MKNEKSILEEIGNKNPYKVPENYFENFADNMDKMIESMPLPEGLTEEKEVTPVKPASGKVISLVSDRLKPLLKVAAVVAILCGTSYLAVQPILEEAKMQQEIMMAEIEFTEDDYQYLLDEYDTEDMYYLLTSNQ
jgi:hypothetical protein